MACHSPAKCLTHLLDMKNENIDDFNPEVGASGGGSSSKWPRRRRTERNPSAFNRSPRNLNRRCHCSVISRATGVSNQVTGVGNHTTAAQETSAVCGDAPYCREMHEVSRGLINGQ